MKSNKKIRKKKKSTIIFIRIFGIIGLIIFLMFCIMLYLLDMLPNKYLALIYTIFGFAYLIFELILFVKKVKYRIQSIVMIIMLIFSVIFCIGIKYIYDTIDFQDIINDKIVQKEDYYLCSLDKSNFKNINDYKDKVIGIYKTLNSERAFDELKKKINVEFIEFDSLVDLYNDLDDGLIDGVLVNDSAKELLSTELNDLNIVIRDIDKVSIVIEEKDIVKVVDVTRKPFNIYIAGGDAYGSINKVMNTDVNMVVSIDPVYGKILLTSIPRDYYVNLPGLGEDAYDKLTHAGYYGINESVGAVEKLLDININYYVKVNFSTIEKVVDAIGGIDVYSDFSFSESAFHLYTFTKGWNHLDGHMALAFARERKSFDSGDVQRVKNQQKVIQAVISKFTKSTTLITRFSNILDSIKSNFATNMETKDMNKFIKGQLKNMKSWSIESQNLTGSAFYARTYTFPKMDLWAMKSNESSLNNAKIKIKEFFYEKNEE